MYYILYYNFMNLYPQLTLKLTLSPCSFQVSKNVVPHSRQLCVAVKRHLEQMLTTPPPVEATVETPVAAAYRESASAMEPLIAKNRQTFGGGL